MSFSGKFTPLQLNLLGELSGAITKDNLGGTPRGFNINPVAKAQQGTWSGTSTAYTQGTLTNNTALKDLTSAIQVAYTKTNDGDTGAIKLATYRRLINMGTSCPALANGKPTTFKGTYAGYGSWQGSTMVRDSYPPKNYPTNGTYSYVYQTYSKYAFVTGWPGNNAWQKAPSATANGDTYKGAIEGSRDYDEYMSNGFIGTIARQAYYELYYGQFNQVTNITNSFTTNANYRDQQNGLVASYINGKSFMSGTYSNINDLSTNNISGVNQAFKLWGDDIINAGRALDLSNISKFGLPSVLLRTLQANNVFTAPVKLALIGPADSGFGGLTLQEVEQICSPAYTPTPEQEGKIYTAFTLIQGADLSNKNTGILYGLNCATAGLTSLADLLNPVKLFPNSYNSLTIPRFNADRSISTSAKIYDFIYINGGVNDRIQNWGYYLEGILAPNLVKSCGAFAMTMQQIPYISNMDVEKFGQVVANLELTNKDLPLINQTIPGSPMDGPITYSMTAALALGSGNNGSYRQCDFYGAASGFPYSDYYTIANSILARLPLTALTAKYAQILTAANAGDDTLLNTYITDANTLITNVYAGNTALCDQLNYYWDLIGNQMTIEQRAIPMSIVNSTDFVIQTNDSDVFNFTRQLEQYAQDNSDGQAAPVLERISDTTSSKSQGGFGGQCLVAVLREARNAVRTSLTNSPLQQNDVDNKIDTCAASASVTVVNGSITAVTVLNGSRGYTNNDLPTIVVYPVGLGAKLTPVLAEDGSIRSITVNNGGKGYAAGTVTIEIDSPPQCQPANLPQQTYADTPYSQLVPPELTTPTSASPDVHQAIEDVTLCNCDCWL